MFSSFSDKAVSKLKEYNDALQSQHNPLSLTASEFNSLQDFVSALDPSKGSLFSSNFPFEISCVFNFILGGLIKEEHGPLFVKLLQWPKDQLFPITDVLRMCFLNRDADSMVSHIKIGDNDAAVILISGFSPFSPNLLVLF